MQGQWEHDNSSKTKVLESLNNSPISSVISFFLDVSPIWLLQEKKPILLRFHEKFKFLDEGLGTGRGILVGLG